jgi:hypothetical protein
MRPGFEVMFFGFEFGAAELSLEKFRNALKFFVVFLGDGFAGRGNDHRQKDEIGNDSRCPARALPCSRKLIAIARPPRKQQSADFQCSFCNSSFFFTAVSAWPARPPRTARTK